MLSPLGIEGEAALREGPQGHRTRLPSKGSPSYLPQLRPGLVPSRPLSLRSGIQPLGHTPPHPHPLPTEKQENNLKTHRHCPEQAATKEAALSLQNPSMVQASPQPHGAPSSNQSLTGTVLLSWPGNLLECLCTPPSTLCHLSPLPSPLLCLLHSHLAGHPGSLRTGRRPRALPAAMLVAALSPQVQFGLSGE